MECFRYSSTNQMLTPSAEIVHILEKVIFLGDTVIFSGAHSFCFSCICSLNTYCVHDPVKSLHSCDVWIVLNVSNSLALIWQLTAQVSTWKYLSFERISNIGSTWKCTFKATSQLMSHLSCGGCVLWTSWFRARCWLRRLHISGVCAASPSLLVPLRIMSCLHQGRRGSSGIMVSGQGCSVWSWSWTLPLGWNDFQTFLIWVLLWSKAEPYLQYWEWYLIYIECPFYPATWSKFQHA